MVENEVEMKIKCLRSENGGEFNSNEFYSYCEENGIIRHFSVASTPQQNGVLERKNRTAQEMARTILIDSKVSDVLWVQAVHTIVYTLNICLLRSNSDKTPYELWKGRPANVNASRYLGVSSTLSGRTDLVCLNLYLMMSYSSGIQVIVKNKIDLI